MIRACSRAGYRWQEAERWLQKASEAKLVADTQLMNAVLSACAKAGPAFQAILIDFSRFHVSSQCKGYKSKCALDTRCEWDGTCLATGRRGSPLHVLASRHVVG